MPRAIPIDFGNETSGSRAGGRPDWGWAWVEGGVGSQRRIGAIFRVIIIIIIKKNLNRIKLNSRIGAYTYAYNIVHWRTRSGVERGVESGRERWIELMTGRRVEGRRWCCQISRERTGAVKSEYLHIVIITTSHVPLILLHACTHESRILIGFSSCV